MRNTKKNSQCFVWKIRPHFAQGLPDNTLKEYVRQAEQLVKKLIPESLCFEDKGDFISWTNEFLPVVQWTDPTHAPDAVSIIFLCRASKVFKTEFFFLNIIKNWLSPEKEISVLSFRHLYFHFEGLPGDSFFVAHMQILLEDSGDLNCVKENLPSLAKEITAVSHSSHYAKYFLEAKALSSDTKATLIHQELIRVIQKFPHIFDRTIFLEMSRFLALSEREFMQGRSQRHITKLLCAHHVIRKSLAREAARFPQERHLQLRIAQTRLHFAFGTKPVLGLILGICLFDKYEFFEEKHVLLAVQKLIPSAQAVKGSFYAYQGPQEMIRKVYLEIEKRDGSSFSLQERKVIKQFLSNELKASVEKLIPAVFMIRNEEEIMKNILLLSQEVKYSSDLPQLMISLEQQTATDFLFVITLVRVLREKNESLDKLFQNAEIEAEFTSERVQIVGYLRKKYPKEANVFSLRIAKQPEYLRADSSLNFYLARQKVIEMLNRALGDVRDYNGGMILRQVEQFSEFKQVFSYVSNRYPDLLENFFYSISPIEMQATLPLEQLQTLFRLFLESIETPLTKRESYCLKIQQKETNVFVLIRAREASFKEAIVRHLSLLEIFPKSLVSTNVEVESSHCIGYIYGSSDQQLQRRFLEAIQSGIEEWLQKLKSLQVLRLGYIYFPLSLDPRIGGDENSKNILELLFEGLMRMGKEGKPVCALAKSFEISSDQKCYTFKLRDSLWSNGDKVTAYDFEYAWKKILSPDFVTPFGYLFYPIKNAKSAKEGKISLDAVQVKALDYNTLYVELEHPTPYFLELTAFTLYSPVNHTVDKIHPNWAAQEGQGYVCNGPFQLQKKRSTRYELTKNPLYWHIEKIQLDQVLVFQDNSYTVLQMFKNNEIDWLGRPLYPWDSTFEGGCEEKMEFTSVPRIFWYVFNVKRFPFTNVKLRRAFAYAINRKQMLEKFKYHGSAALTPLPLAHTFHLEQGIQDGDKEYALQLFEEALKELGLTRKKFPVITMLYANGETRDNVARLLKDQWEKLFGITCNIEGHEWNVVFDRMTQGDYQLGNMNWKAFVNDPIYTLNAFRYSSERVNFAKWENEEYQKILDAADQEPDSEKHKEHLKHAEAILLREMPVVPIFYEVQEFKKKKHLKIAVNHQLGLFDFATASITKTP